MRAGECPSPVRREWEQDPHVASHGAGEMDHRCIDRDDQIGNRDDRGGIGHVGKSGAKVSDIGVPRKQCSIVVAQLALDADEGNTFDPEQRFK